jgi:hypothetical protein
MPRSAVTISGSDAVAGLVYEVAWFLTTQSHVEIEDTTGDHEA